MFVIPPVPPAPQPLIADRYTVPSSVPSDGVVGLIDNGKSMAAEIMTSTVAGLGNAERSLSYVVQKKPSAGRVMTLERRAELLARARLVISGVGD